MARKTTTSCLMSDNVYTSFPLEPPAPGGLADARTLHNSANYQAEPLENVHETGQTIPPVKSKLSSTYRPHHKRHKWTLVFLSRSTFCTHGLIRWFQCQRCGLVFSDAAWKRNRVPECPGAIWTFDAMPATAEEVGPLMPNLRNYRYPRPKRAS